MTARGTRGIALVLALLALALAAAAAPAWGASGDAQAKPNKSKTARPGPVRTGSGIVQAVRPHAVVVRQLDGRVLVVPVAPRTVVIVNGGRSSLGAVQPGFVVSFVVRGGKVVQLNVTGGVPEGPKPGTVQSVSADAVVVATQSGGALTIAVGGRTQVFLNNSPVAITDIVAGDRLVKVKGDASGPKPPRVLRFRRPG
jgi:hypothetical protein